MNGLGLAQIVCYCRERQKIQANPRQWQVLHHIEDCRTQKMGTGSYQCNGCGHRWFWHHSCRDRHCPQCQRQASDAWVDRQKSQLVPAPYFHIVFTLPHALNDWVGRHGRTLYSALFHSAWGSLNGLADRKYHGQAGMTCVLHTWGQNLSRHVHLHCLVPAGVLTDKDWKPIHKGYFLPVKLLSNRFRGTMVSQLRQGYEQGALSTIDKATLDGTLSHLMSHPWVVYCKSALEYRETLVSYLARYTYRVGLSNHRLESWKDNQVTLSYFDNKANKASRLSLKPAELIRRFLLHVLPKGFMRIRHYGYLSNAIKKRSLEKIKRQSDERKEKAVEAEADTVPMGCRCPACGESTVVYLGEINYYPQLGLNSS